MKKQEFNRGKKLTKKQLKSIAGGVMICTHSGGGCAQIHPTCYEKQCRPGTTIVCMPTSNTCNLISFNCVEPPCWPNLEPPVQ